MTIMELCAARGISNLPPLPPKHFPSCHSQLQSIRCKTRFPFLHNRARFSSGFQCYRNSPAEATSNDTSDTTLYVKDEPKTDGVITVEDTSVEKKDDYTPVEKKDDYTPVEKKEDDDSQLNEEPQEVSLMDNPLQLFKFLQDFDIKLDYEETYSILVFGGGGAVALWLLAAVLNAIDSIPLFPKVLELVGLGYTLWFSSRYLIFKKNRDELVDRVEQIKQQVLGSKDD
ncbi:hypothetical protein CDL12_10360 [Handroanthus impetiginosus]|uniref:Cyanobacterial aminoacyl-tRNA synthetase CAAD domain-containing protein n=1 Tax=Handroanthus impetiginosus TaxID=429701 RepID=A0A2G9HHD6_9LAMI|nr:hypothetical protein CDL12_10360 [Handroanthus impetiginosus]